MISDEESTRGETGGGILLVSSDRAWQRVVAAAVAGLGTLTTAETLEEGLNIVHAGLLAREEHPLVIIDSREEPTPADGVFALRQLSRDIRVVVASAAPTWRMAREVLDAGAVDFIVRHDDQELLRGLLEGSLDAKPPATSKLEESDRGQQS